MVEISDELCIIAIGRNEGERLNQLPPIAAVSGVPIRCQQGPMLYQRRVKRRRV